MSSNTLLGFANELPHVLLFMLLPIPTNNLLVELFLINFSARRSRRSFGNHRHIHFDGLEFNRKFIALTYSHFRPRRIYWSF